LFDTIKSQNKKNIVVLTGDIHSAWANELPGKKYKSRSGKNSLGVEFIAPSVTSARGIPISKGIVKCFNKHVKFLELDKKGFFVLDINQKRVQADWFFEETVITPTSKSSHGASFYVNKGETKLNEIDLPSERVKINPEIVK
jgi:alkaline phosphatase D